MHTDTTHDILDRICPDEAGRPPSARTWARIIRIAGGFEVLELRDPDASDPASCPRHQYMISPLAPQRSAARLWRRRLPPAPLNAPPVEHVVCCGGPHSWADSLGDPHDADPAAAWELVAPSATSLPWEWATAQGVRPYAVAPLRATGEWDIHGDGDPETEGYVMPPRSPWDVWAAVTGAPCPAAGCDQELTWYEAGYVPGYRVCMARDGDHYDAATLRHRWLWTHDVLVRDTGDDT